MRASEMQKGQTVRVDDKLYAVVDYQHVKLGKGGAVFQTKLKGLRDGLIQNIRLRFEGESDRAHPHGGTVPPTVVRVRAVG